MMRAFYPASNNFDALSDHLIALKIARHTPCELCDDCPGLHPAPHFHILRDTQPPENSLTDLAQYGSDEEDNGIAYLRMCGCGHTPQRHGANAAELGEEELTRRANLALRIDNHLEVRFPFWITSRMPVCNTPVNLFPRCGVSTARRPFLPIFDAHIPPTRRCLGIRQITRLRIFRRHD
jgi:hypothetical protein